MRTYERNQVHVDQCTGCGGLFLDRGELEALVVAETAWYQTTQPHAPQRPYPSQPQGAWNQPATHAQQAPYRAASKTYCEPGYGRRKKSFLNELFD
jgi:Zn-finger nucleic acid-binding protein